MADALAAAGRGDLGAWRWIVRLQQETVFRSAYLVTRDSALAEDVTKTVFLRAFRSLTSLDDPARLRPWLIRLTDAAARSRLRESAQRRDARTPEVILSPRLPASRVHLLPGAPTPTALDHATLSDGFDRLNATDRSILAARYAFRLDRDAAAVCLAVAPTKVDGLLAAVVARLRARTLGSTADIPAAEHHRLAALSDDQLASMTMVAVMSELTWTPDVAPAVCDRLAREAVAYGETSVSRDRPLGPAPSAPSQPSGRRRTGSRGSSISRFLGLVSGVSLLVVALAVAGGIGRDQAASSLAAHGSRVGSALDGPVASPATTSSDAVAAARAHVAPIDGTTGSPAATLAEPTEAVAPGEAATSEPDDTLVSVVGARRAGDGSLRAVVRLDWPLGGAVEYRSRLEQRVGAGTWVPLAWTDSDEPLLVELSAGTMYGLRVRSVDDTGLEAVSAPARLKLVVRTARSDRLVRSRGDWVMRRGPSGQRRLVAVSPGARVTTEFSGMDVAVLGRLPSGQDSIGLRVDGGPWVWDADPIAQSGRTVLYREELDAGRHSLDVHALGDGMALEAVLILRSVSA